MEPRNEKPITIRINKKNVPVSKEIKGAWYEMINRNRYFARKTYSCGQPDFRVCCGDCPLCPWYRQGIVWNFGEERIGDGADIDSMSGTYAPVDNSPGPAELAESRDTVERVLKYARSVCEDGDLILAMRMEGLSSHEIAKRLDTPQKTMYRRIRKLMAAVGQYYIMYFM